MTPTDLFLEEILARLVQRVRLHRHVQVVAPQLRQVAERAAHLVQDGGAPLAVAGQLGEKLAGEAARHQIEHFSI